MSYEVLEDWNPWWSGGPVPGELLGVERDVRAEVLARLEDPKIVHLIGVRRCGKSTIAYQTIQALLDAGVEGENVLFVNFEDPALSGMDLGQLLSTYQQNVGPRGMVYAFLDEVQVSEGWERWALREYERKRPYRFVVTGSSSHLIRSDLSRLLTGRTWEIRVTPLSFPEFLRFSGDPLSGLAGTELRDRALHWMDAYIERGGFPEVVMQSTSQRRTNLQRYLDDILYRDVVHPHGVVASDLEELVTYILSNIGSPLSLRSMEEAVSPSVNTIKRYLALLEDAMLVMPVRQLTFKTRPSVRERLQSKYFCVDTGLRNAVAHRHSTDLGSLAENLVCSGLHREREQVQFWKGDHEVDFVVGRRPGPLTPVNVCMGDEVPEREYEGLAEFGASVKGSRGEPLMLTRTLSERRGGVEHRPLWRWLLDRP
jgi:predicted AAA+ superfamily ATPase